jgi:hypothetical protein
MKILSRRTALLLWIVAVIITLCSVVYQRVTGPTHPVHGKISVGKVSMRFWLPRSSDSGNDAMFVMKNVAAGISGEVRWRRLHSHDDWTTQPLTRDGANLEARIPSQPPAGKVQYQITLIAANGVRAELTPEPVTMRFKGHVSAVVLIPHIFCMFFSMLIATRAGLEALFRGSRMRALAWWTAGLLFAGGIVLGPVVQKFAFDAFWTGWPFGHDLTDNKTALAFLMWMAALYQRRKEGRGRGWMMAASIVQLLVYLIPHSMFGSELDYTKP